MSRLELSPVAKDIFRIWLWGLLPLGPAALAISRSGQDSITQSSIHQLRELLPYTSIVVGDLHRKKLPVDMFATATELAKLFPDLHHMAGAIGMEWTENSTNPIQKTLGGEFLRVVQLRNKQLHLYPVTRVEDQDNIPQELYDQKSQTNKEYLKRIDEHLTLPQTIVLVALRGTRASNNETMKIKDGFLHQSRYYPTAISVSYPRGAFYEMILSPVLRFNPAETDEHIRAELTRQLESLEARIP